MLAKVNSCAIVGLEGTIVEVEVDSSRGLSSFTLVGLPDAAVKESAERVHAAIKNSGMHFPTNRMTVNLAPADLRKVGPAYDLPMAALLPNVEVIVVNQLANLVAVLNGVTDLPAATHDTLLDNASAIGPSVPVTDFREIKGQEACP